MGTKDNGDDLSEDWSSHASSPSEAFHQFPQEGVKVAAEEWHNGFPGSPILPLPEQAPRHRRAHSEIPSLFYKKSTSTSSFHRWKSQMQRALQWGGRSFQDRHYSSFDPEILANQKRQWYQIHSKTSGPEIYKEPTSLFEHFIIAGLGPDAKLQVVEDAFVRRKKWEHESERNELLDFHSRKHQRPTFPTLEPQVLFVYPPGKKLSLRIKDLAAFCFPGGVKARMMERTPSLSDLNELVYGQEHLRRDDLSFIFSLKVAGNTTLYGVCLHVQEVVQRPPVVFEASPPLSQLNYGSSRFLVSAPRCYCILTRVPFFELHYEMLNSIIAQERLNRITKFVAEMSLAENAPSHPLPKNHINEKFEESGNTTDWMATAIPVGSAITLTAAAAGIISDEEAFSRCENSPVSVAASDNSYNCQMMDGDKNVHASDDCISETSEFVCTPVNLYDCSKNQCRQSFESLFSPARSLPSEEEDDIFSNYDEDLSFDMIMEWARENKNDLLQIICGYHSLHLPARGGKVIFQPLEHLQAIEFQRVPISALGLFEKYLDKNTKDSSQLKLAIAEEAVALSLWSTATICRVLSLESVLAIVTGVLLEKQVVLLCPNLGVLSAVVLSLIPIIRPFEWQSLFLPILPTKMFDFLDAPVPFIVGIQQKLADMKMRTPNLVQVNINKNQVKTCNLPQLPQRKELISELGPIHSILSSEECVAQKNPVYKCNEVQAEAAAQFLYVMRRYLESLCSDLRLHTITSVQSNNDKVSILLKDSFIDSFPSRDRAFVKLFVETQLFTVLSDSRLSSYENE
ncbi:DENN (AEX-3) domain-containing protein [Striga hermonthica]|uniref:DENN (AEX-3) domain-containing protein n=1 Tax=Striga hermonthica TaxID=68872 RepID=A0A9N7MX79_STRHE|nr:DENN (AEX-3) domain-containing protein [Striga hermonthica]